MSQLSPNSAAGSHAIVNRGNLCKNIVRTWLKMNNTNTMNCFFKSIW
jgi:hypothetical protein